ncbi:MAG: hypothetical protein GX308_05780 [Epulopiscium sp.]|nr:hypothetical protein [Candidatus Epulonipiscium sp.]
MIDFKEELRKFKPALEVDGIEEVIKSNEIKDMIDLLTHITRNLEIKSEGKE